MTVGAYMGDGFNTPSYPTAFGITLTPQILGVVAALAGIGLAGYIGAKMVMPQIEQSQETKASIDLKQRDFDKKTATIARRDELVAQLTQEKAKQGEVLGLFSDQKSLDTLLLDLNRVITTSNANLSNFTPNYETSGIVSDGSLGPELNYKLKRQVTDVSFAGTFAQSLSIMQAIDRLQTVLVIQDLKMNVVKSESLGEPDVTSTFKLFAYVPLSAEEAQVAKAAAEAAAKEPEKK
jgi:type IV pilus assembly protein PilO